MKTVYIVVNGILTSPGDAKEWTDCAVTWLHNCVEADVQAEKFEYFAGALTRRFRQQRHAEELGDLIRSYHGRRIRLITHSNGADLFVRAMQTTATDIDSAHIIAGACEEDFGKNGLNEDLLVGQIRNIHVYTSPDDKVLKYAARPSRALFGWMGLGYGLLGLVGPQNVAIPSRVHCHNRPGYGHSTWLTKENLPSTMKLILENDR